MDPTTHKTCPLCQRSLPLTEFGRLRDGYQPRCKACRNQQRKDRYNANRTQELEWRARYVAENPNKCAEYGRKWRANNSDRDRERDRNHYQANKKKVLSAQRAAREQLTDSYVRKVITGHKGYRGEEITAERIEQARQQIRQRRLDKAAAKANRDQRPARSGAESELTDAYIRRVIKKARDYAGQDITDEMIKAARERIEDKRNRRQTRAEQA